MAWVSLPLNRKTAASATVLTLALERGGHGAVL
jgi:hypothetical protein